MEKIISINIKEINVGEYIIAYEKHIANRKTPIYDLYNKNNGTALGQIKWYCSWMQYCFYPTDKTLFNSKCLQDLVCFINNLNKQKKEGC